MNETSNNRNFENVRGLSKPRYSMSNQQLGNSPDENSSGYYHEDSETNGMRYGERKLPKLTKAHEEVKFPQIPSSQLAKHNLNESYENERQYQ